jgi:hypothetical protein
VMLLSGLEMLSKRWGTASRPGKVTPQLSPPLKPPARRPKVCLSAHRCGAVPRTEWFAAATGGVRLPTSARSRYWVDGRDRELLH